MLEKTDSLNETRSHYLASKRRLDEANTAFRDAADKYFNALEKHTEQRYLEAEKSTNSTRLPKGRVEKLIRLVFSSGYVTALKFAELHVHVEKLARESISKTTLKKSISRMSTKGELESRAGKWAKGPKMKEDF